MEDARNVTKQPFDGVSQSSSLFWASVVIPFPAAVLGGVWPTLADAIIAIFGLAGVVLAIVALCKGRVRAGVLLLLGWLLFMPVWVEAIGAATK